MFIFSGFKHVSEQEWKLQKCLFLNFVDLFTFAADRPGLLEN